MFQLFDTLAKAGVMIGMLAMLASSGIAIARGCRFPAYGMAIGSLMILVGYLSRFVGESVVWNGASLAAETSAATFVAKSLLFPFGILIYGLSVWWFTSRKSGKYGV